MAFVKVRVLDEHSTLVPDADNMISFEISGPGLIVATDNGDPTDFTPFPSKKRQSFNGLALAVIKSKENVAGNIVLSAISTNLKSAQITILNNK